MYIYIIYRRYLLLLAGLMFLAGCAKHSTGPFGPPIDSAGTTNPENPGNKVIIAELLIDDFNDGDMIPVFFEAGSWSEGRDMFSEAYDSLQTNVLPSGQTNIYLRLEYTVKDGEPYPGISESISFSPDQAFYSEYNAITLRIRGSGSQISLSLGTSIYVDYDNYKAPLLTSGEWAELLIPFDDFTTSYFPGHTDGTVTRADCLNKVNSLSFGNGNVGDTGWFEIDDIRMVKFIYKR